MKRKLDTRFPAARIKKIMQTDEDVGKIALPVPVLVSKALELFLQDLCDRTYSITLKRGVKTMSSFHLKQCVHKFNTFDFLKDVVSKVPDVGVSDAGPDDRSAKRRRTADEDNSKEEEIKGNKNQKAGESSGRRQGRGRGSGRGSRGVHDVEISNAITDKYEDDPGTPQQDDESVPPPTSTDGIATRLPEEAIVSRSRTCNHVRNFDLNLDFDAATGDTSPTTATPTISEANHDMRSDCLEESMPSIDKITIDPPRFALSHQILEEEEEDYDKEEG